MSIYSLAERVPQVHESAWVADSAAVVGSVKLEAKTSVWFAAVVRGDVEQITIGEGSNVQDGAVLHADLGFPLVVGRDVTIGHQAMLHGCTVGDGALIGIHAVVLNGAVIGEGSLVGAHALVTEGKVFPPYSLIVGAPAKVARTFSPEEAAAFRRGATHYVDNAAHFKKDLKSWTA
jgi:carbonic anhydrase/acetyltransferase-like protein (isoleucine patch superfamily)